MTEKQVTGRVVARFNHLYHVVLDATPDMAAPLLCHVKGVLKKASQAAEAVSLDSRAVLVGDHVTLDHVELANQQAQIADILPRASVLARPAVANVSQALVVHPVAEPELDLETVDRFLAHVHAHGLSAKLLITKLDLSAPSEDALDSVRGIYEPLGVKVHGLSIYDGPSLGTLKAALEAETGGGVFVLAGPSGAGKSSLINALLPEAELRTQAVSAKTGRGQQTTRHVQLLPLTATTWLADTPGFQQATFQDTSETLLKAYPEFARFTCAFADCRHQSDESDNWGGCGLPEAMAQGAVAPSRAASYQTLLTEALAYEAEQAETSSKARYGEKTVYVKGRQRALPRLSHNQRAKGRNVSRQALQTHVNRDDPRYQQDPDDPQDF